MVAPYSIRCLFGPNLHRIYPSPWTTAKEYDANSLEHYGNKVMSVVNFMFKLGYISCPILLPLMYRRDWFSQAGLVSILENLAGVGFVYSVALFVRAAGRFQNLTYRQFLDVFSAASRDFSPTNAVKLSAYDFGFRALPVEFHMPLQRTSLNLIPHSEQSKYGFIYFPLRILAWFMVRSFGIHMLYPGMIMYSLLGCQVQAGRENLVVEKGGRRFKLRTADNNDIDTIFVNRRNAAIHGSTLVVSCEGNAGFYEFGVVSTPLEAGYSVLGWNHPGFGGSTGLPLPSQEANAIDAVMQFAIQKLGFKPEDIIIHGWSIGGFTASWAAMHYPDVRAVILDATFDDILPLAVEKMPRWLSLVVKLGIIDFVNLNVGDQLTRYNGPIKIIRRELDEVITTDENDIKSNRGNFLLKQLLQFRYPELFKSADAVKVLDNYVSLMLTRRTYFIKLADANSAKMNALLSAAMPDGPRSFPCDVGKDLSIEDRDQLITFLASRYMIDSSSSHCSPLPASMFTPPWEVTYEEEAFEKL